MPREQACLIANLCVFITFLVLLLAVYIPSKQITEEGTVRAAQSQLELMIQESTLLSSSVHLVSETRFNILKWKFEDYQKRYSKYGVLKLPEIERRIALQQKLINEMEEYLAETES